MNGPSDDKSLMKNREVCKSFQKAIDDQKFTWIRIMKGVSQYEKWHEECHSYKKLEGDEDGEFSGSCDCKFELNAWKKIMSEGDFETIKGLGNSLRKMYVLKEGWIRGIISLNAWTRSNVRLLKIWSTLKH